MSEENNRCTSTTSNTSIPLSIRLTSGEKHNMTVETLDQTILEFKTLLVSLTHVQVALQRLIYKGRVLKDKDTLAFYGVQSGHTIHFVKGSAPKTTVVTPAAAAVVTNTSSTGVVLPAVMTTSTNTMSASAGLNHPWGQGHHAAPGVGVNGTAGQTSMNNPMAGFGNMGNMGNMAQMQQEMSRNPAMMSEMLNNPMVQSVMNNPDMMRNIMTSNPQMRQVMEQNPQLNHVFNDPELLRQSMEAMRNPQAMQDMMRNQDTAMRNIESHPEGFNALRRMYTDVQEPLMNASAQAAGPQTGASFPMPGGTPTTSNSTTAPAASNAANSNPWAAPNATNAANPWLPNTSVPATNNAATGGNNLNAMSSQMSSMMLNNPALMSQMSSMMQDPQMMQQVMDSNPQLQSMMTPQMRSMMSNPETLRALMNPTSMQAMLQFQSAQSNTATNPAVPNTAGGTVSNANLMNALNLLGSGTAAANASGVVPSSLPTAATNPGELYASQISQLNEMGFTNREQNIRALQSTMGNVNAAVERILGGLA